MNLRGNQKIAIKKGFSDKETCKWRGKIGKEPTRPSQGRIFKAEVTACAKALRNGSLMGQGTERSQ